MIDELNDTIPRLEPIEFEDDGSVYEIDDDELKIEQRIADERYKELNDKYDLDHPRKIDMPDNPDIHRYHNKDEFKLGRDYRKNLFFNLLPEDQMTYARNTQFWLEDLKSRGFDPNDPDVQSIADYNAGTQFINWLNNLDESSVRKHYYYREYKFRKYFYYDPKDMESWTDFDLSIDDFFGS